MSFSVIFHGKNAGVYDSCTPCSNVVRSCELSTYENYNTYDEAVQAWEKYCKKSGRTQVDFQNGLLHPQGFHAASKTGKGSSSGAERQIQKVDHVKGSTSNSNAAVVAERLAWETLHLDATYFAENTNNCQWIIQHNMQQELENLCNKLGYIPPTYTNQEVRVRKGIPYVRFNVATYKIDTHGTQETIDCGGRFATQSNDAKEDAAVVAIRRLLEITGHKIRDFNHYNVKILEQKIQFLEAEKNTFKNINRILNEEIDLLLPKVN